MEMRATVEECPVEVKIQKIVLQGSLCIPSTAKGIVVFAHGSGSSRLSPRNHFVARELWAGKLGTLLFDLLTEEEEDQDQYNAELRFNIPLLTKRLVGATYWLLKSEGLNGFKIGYFGASTGAAAALAAAAERPEVVEAVVSRGGRPDLAMEALPKVKAPTLLIVGGHDKEVIEMNRHALRYLETEKKIEIVPGATHLFEEPGAIERVAELARDWFSKYLNK
jgi:putative phosphoribosyl transferase